MLDDLWTEIRPTIVQAIIGVIIALSALAVSLITRWRARLEAKFEIAKSAAIAVENSPAARLGSMTGPDKLATAVDIAMAASAKTGRFAAMTEAEAKQQVEKALPSALRESHPGALKPGSG